MKHTIDSFNSFAFIAPKIDQFIQDEYAKNEKNDNKNDIFNPREEPVKSDDQPADYQVDRFLRHDNTEIGNQFH